MIILQDIHILVTAFLLILLLFNSPALAPMTITCKVTTLMLATLASYKICLKIVAYIALCFISLRIMHILLIEWSIAYVMVYKMFTYGFKYKVGQVYFRNTKYVY